MVLAHLVNKMLIWKGVYMEIHEALVAYLLTRTGLTALVGNRIFPKNAVTISTIKPYIIYQYISNVKDHDLNGQISLESPCIQYTVYADNDADTFVIGRQLKAALQDYHGVLSGLTIQWIELLNELSGSSDMPDGTSLADTLDQEYQVNFNYE